MARNYQVKLISPIFDRVEKVLSMVDSNKELIVNIGSGYRNELSMHLAYKYNINSFYEKFNEKIDILKDKYKIKLYCEPGRG